MILSEPVSRLLLNVQVMFSPSLRSIVAVELLTVCVPQFGLVTEHTIPVKSSTSAKFASGAGDAVKGKDVGPLGVASLMIVIEAR
jgi:hypothetical protein